MVITVNSEWTVMIIAVTDLSLTFHTRLTRYGVNECIVIQTLWTDLSANHLSIVSVTVH